MSAYQRILHGRRTIATLVAVATLSAGTTRCDDAEIEAGYKPPFVPIMVSINERGELSVSFDDSIVTPIGTFSLTVTPRTSVDEGDGLLEILHYRDGEPVMSLFQIEEFAKGEAELTVSGGTDVEKSGDRERITIEVPPGAQEFTLEVDDEEAVAAPSTTSVTEWSEPAPTTTPPESSTAPPESSENPTSSPSDVPASFPPATG
jgi:hypothetical protein